MIKSPTYLIKYCCIYTVHLITSRSKT